MYNSSCFDFQIPRGLPRGAFIDLTKSFTYKRKNLTTARNSSTQHTSILLENV